MGKKKLTDSSNCFRVNMYACMEVFMYMWKWMIEVEVLTKTSTFLGIKLPI